MKITFPTLIFALALLLLSGMAGAMAATIVADDKDEEADKVQAIGSAFTYQGRLFLNNSPANGAFTLNFKLFGQANGGAQIGTTISTTQVITAGLFTSVLDFGSSPFSGERRFVELAARKQVTSTFTTLSPRQEINPVPYAMFATTAQSAQFAVQAGTANTSTVAAQVPWLGVNSRPYLYKNTMPVNTITTLDAATASGAVGQYTSATIGADGLPLISYYDAGNKDLKVLHCNDVKCTSAQKYALDTAGDVGKYTSIALGTDKLGVISYYDVTGGNLKLAHCSNTNCSAAIVKILDGATGSQPNVGQFTSLAILPDSASPIISYYDVTNHDLKVVNCTDALCAGRSLITLDSDGDVGQFTSIVINPFEAPQIVYYDASKADLKIDGCDSQGCHEAFGAKVVVGVGHVGLYASMVIGSDGKPIISYYDADDKALTVAHCRDFTCTQLPTTTRLIRAVDCFDPCTPGINTSITIGNDGLPVISSYEDRAANGRGSLYVSHCSDLACSEAVNKLVWDDELTTGSNGAITIGSDGTPLVSFLYKDNMAVVHCDTPTCTEVRRR